MKSFEEILAMEKYKSDSRDGAALKRRTDRQLTREERERRKYRNAWRAAVIAWALFVAILFTVPSVVSRSMTEDTPQAPEPVQEPAEAIVEVEPAAEECPEDHENEKIEAALLETGYFRDDIPLDFETQAYLRAACTESGVPFELALAVIRKETTYRNVTGDGGESAGYMQVQEKWHGARMEKLGVTDLSDPFSNFRVGCDYLAELLGKYPLEKALTAYNSGSPGHSEYADIVIGYMEELIAVGKVVVMQ